MAITRMSKNKRSAKGKSSSQAFTTKMQAKSAAKLANAQAKLIQSQAKANVITAKQSRMRERNKTARFTAMATSFASPWNQVINNSDNTGSYQTGTIGETPESNENSSGTRWEPRG